MNDLFEKDLTASLARHAEAGAPQAPLGLDAVRGRARQIQRRRRGAAAAAVAAVAAVVVPAALALGPGLTRGSEPPPVAPTPERVVTPDHALAGDGSLDFRDLPLGPDAGIGYLDLTGPDPVVVAPGGNETILDLEHTPFRYTDLEDGRLVVLTRDDEGNRYVEVTGAEGTTEELYPNTGGFAVDDSHVQVAWGNQQGQVLVLRSGAQEPRELGLLGEAGTTRVMQLDGTDCFAEENMSFGCVVHVEAIDQLGESTTWTMTRDEATRVRPGDSLDLEAFAASVTAGDPQELDWTYYAAGVREVRDDLSTCSGVWGNDPVTPESAWLIETCDHSFGAFSPDIRTLLAWEAAGDGNHTTIGMYDMETRSLLWERSATTAQMGQVSLAEWEDDQHLLASVFQGGSWQLVRFGRDGAVERVTDLFAGDEVDAPYVPETQHRTG